jgi:hypothetical protein
MNSLRIIILLCCIAFLCDCQPDIAKIKRNCTVVEQLPIIKPDYTGITIPPNIAPLNFTLQDSSTACFAEISFANGERIISWGKKRGISIAEVQWKRLLSQSAGKPLGITIYSRSSNGTWRRYAAIEDTIAAETIDRYCTYRLLNYQYTYSSDLIECQRDITSFNETVLVNGQNYGLGCVNCHTPMNNDPHHFVIQVRSTTYGNETIIACNDSITTLKSRLGYAAWHPEGRLIAFTVYKVEQFFHAVGRQIIDVFDRNSCIVIYDVTTRKIMPVPPLNQQGVLETWPSWSPDGHYLYFCSSPVLWDNSERQPPDNFNRTKYNLLRIEYDAPQNRWGAVDTVLSHEQTGLSIAQPKISPDGRFCLFCMQDYGAYPHTQVTSDLYLMDLTTRQYHKLPINSESNESWHSWSKNSRWILFTSKRDGGIFSRFYFSYIDSSGNAHKPFILPQRDPSFYDTFIKCYNVPELAVAPVGFSERQLLSAIRTLHTTTVPIQPNSTEHSAGPDKTWSANLER